ncbi:hypothetical protein Gpo141_00009712 [Globisporangium polare]
MSAPQIQPSFAWGLHDPQQHLMDDSQELLLDELLLEIFTPQAAFPGDDVIDAEMPPMASMYASPMTSRYTYEDSSSSANGNNNNSSSSSSSRHMSPYPASMTNTYQPGVSPMKKANEYYHGQMPFTAESPTGSSGDENGVYMGDDAEFGLGELDLSAIGSPTSTKASGDEGGGGAGLMGNGETKYDFGELMLSPTGSPMSAKEKRQLEMRRKRNRESMRRVRQRKRIEGSELKKLFNVLEKRLSDLEERKIRRESELAGGAATAMVESTNGIAGAPGPNMPEALEQLRVVEDTFRRENEWLEKEIDKYHQAYVALQDEIEDLREEDALTVAPLVDDPFSWTTSAISFLPQFHQAEMFQFVRHSVIEVMRQVEAAHKIQEIPTELFGWRTRRSVDGSWIHFAVSKDFASEDVEAIAQKTWLVNSQSHTVNSTMPQNHNMKVLRVVNENTVICARNLFFPGDETNYCTIYLLMCVKTAKGYVIAQRSLLPEDCNVLKLHLGSKYSYVNVFYGIILERHTVVNTEGVTELAPEGCKCTFGGLAGNGTEIYVNTWAKDLFIAMLRWENSCVGPLYRLL